MLLKKLISSKVFQNLKYVVTPKRNFVTSSMYCGLFHETDPKSGYGGRKKPPSMKEKIREGLKELKSEIALWTTEMKEHLESDPILSYRAGETDVVWRFTNPDSLNDWVTTSDSDNLEGYSTCSLTPTNHGTALFSGDLCTTVPKDGRVKRAGYCNIKSTRVRKSFKRESFLDWSCYNILVLKVRGDGRSYIINLHTTGYFDITWNDMYNYVLFTRGGPYWQVSKIPFSKFFFSSKGRVQDKQFPIPLNRVTNFGISAGDKINGPFSLEIDYVGLEYDPSHTEEFAYEMYKTPTKYMTGF